MSLLESGENYLEATLMISERKKDVHAIDKVRFSRRTNLDFHALACESALHQRIIGLRMVDILHKSLTLHLGHKSGHRAVHADPEEPHRLSLSENERQRHTKQNSKQYLFHKNRFTQICLQKYIFHRIYETADAPFGLFRNFAVRFFRLAL